MEIVRLENYSFCYPGSEMPALDGVSLSINRGELVVICGKSGSGKSTLLKSLKPELAPYGKKSGRVYFCGREDVADATKIGFMMQNPDNQIVCDTVWHELAFGLENMGMKPEEMRIRVAEIATFFGIEKWYHKTTSELSGGQKQLLNIASVMVMEPELLLLDEPASQLDPIAAGELYSVIGRINSETGTTVILSEHRTDEVFPYARRAVIMEDGKIIADEAACDIGRVLKNSHSDMLRAMPVSVRIFETVAGSGACPVNIRDARTWLGEYTRDLGACGVFVRKEKRELSSISAVRARDIYHRYKKEAGYVLSGLSLDVKKGEIYGILGGNGAGKSTLLWLLAGGMNLQSGRVKINGKAAMLPQNPECLFLKNTLSEDFSEFADDETEKAVRLCRIESLVERNPYDLSGGELQRAALCRVLIEKPDVILMDEPTKGLDAQFKEDFKNLLSDLTERGVSVIMVSHDVEFCAEVCDRCGLMFDGKIITDAPPGEFFGGKKFYTTQTARIFKGYADEIILPEEAIELLGALEETK